MNEEKRKQHQNSDVSSLTEKLKSLEISKTTNEVNILILGETGVGKSTFINAFFNYITFASLNEARSEKLQVVIPSKFTVTDENYQERDVQVGEDHNENIEVGESATQSCRSYIYPIEGTGLKIRLIDTPGVGDTRGIDQDNINFENVLSFIGEFKHLNAICILLKPNNSRLTVMFEFCIKQLLSKLEKSASQNLIFVFTNTRSTFYRPGETLPSLRKLLSTIKDVEIPCEKKNIFCTDNESFRFLAALKNGLQFPQADIHNFSQSWGQSYEECLRMIMYITGDGDNKGLIPHDVKNTISVNEARRLIVQLSQPLAEIAQLIQDNIRAVGKHREELTQANLSISEMRKKMYIPIIDLKVTKLDKPTTVCTSPKCSTVYQVGDKKKWHYRQRCHDPCYLSNVPKEIIGSPELVNCASMNSTGECKLCSCRFQVHMHIYYTSEAFEDKLEDKTMKTNIESKEATLKNAGKVTLELSARLSKLNKERDIIIKTTAKFACFLKTNAIAPYNDAYEAYLLYLVDREKSLHEASDAEVIKQLERMLREYTEEKNAILNAIRQAGNSYSIISADDIISSIQTLHSLEIFGSKIKELFEAQSRARKDENKSKTKEFIFGYKTKAKKSSRFKRGRGKKNNYQPGRGRAQSHHSNSRHNMVAQPGPSFRARPHYSHQQNYPHSQGPNRTHLAAHSSHSNNVPPPLLGTNVFPPFYPNTPQPLLNSTFYQPTYPFPAGNRMPPPRYNTNPEPPAYAFEGKSTLHPNNIPPIQTPEDKPKSRGRGKERSKQQPPSVNKIGQQMHNLHESSSSEEGEYFSSVDD